ncbi:MAG: isoprenylcysteine carboxylmethyltransferase family protein [Planctomycetes bacterium]|nr:isoprenylcysteine carboxylmethyltransferase family protein [Planctomycetota bacterium]
MTSLRAPLEAAGHFLFRTRNALFPAAFLAAVLLFPPPPEHAGPAWLAAGVALLTLGQALRVLTIGLAYIKRGGKDGRIYASGLVTGGVFAHCRNPMYVGNLLALLGLLALSGSPLALAVGGAFFLLAYLSITLAEETYLLGRFGDEYRAYRARVPRFLPRPGGALATLRHPFDWRKVVSKEHGTLYLNVMLAAAVLAYGAHRAGDLDRRLVPVAAVAVAATLLYALARIAKKRTTWLRPEGAR